MAALALVLALVAVALTGCAPRKGGVLTVIPLDANKYDVTYQYTLTKPPPSGGVYIFWLVNPDANKMVKIGTVQPGVNKIVRVQVDFLPTGAIVSPEPNDGVDHPGDDWELLDGQTSKTQSP